MSLTKADLVDLDFVDAPELQSDGTTVFLTLTVVSTASSTKLVTVNLASDGEGVLYSADHPLEPGDLVTLSGTTGGADGTYTVATVDSDTTFTVSESIADSTGGSADCIYKAGALTVGIDPTGMTNTTATDLQSSLQDLDQAMLNSSRHETIRQLVHLAEIGGPFEGFSGAYREILPAGNPFPTSVIWWLSSAKAGKIIEKTVTRNSNQTPATIEWKVYDTDGSTVLGTATDTITYVNNVFEATRTRTYV